MPETAPGSELQARLAAVDLPQTVVVPGRYRKAVANLEALTAAGAPYNEAQRLKRALRASGQSFEEASQTMGVADSTFLCRQKVWLLELTPGETLKLMAALGPVAQALGEDVAIANVATALAPAVVADTRTWFQRRMAENKADFAFGVALRQEFPKYRQAIRKLWDAFMQGKYHIRPDGTEAVLGAGETCFLPVTPYTHPWREEPEWKAPAYWEAHKAEVM